MKEAFLLLLFLIPSSTKKYLIYKSVTLDEPLPVSLSTSTTIDTYFYTITGRLDYDYLYLHLSDNSYGLNSVSYCLTNYTPVSGYDTSEIEYCNYKSLEASDTKSSGNTQDFYYKINSSKR